MAVLEGGVSALLAGVAEEAAKALHTTIKPVPYGALGHYRTNHRCALVATQGANSRLFSIRNTHATNIIIPTRLVVKAIQSGAGTAQEASIDVFKVTGFTVDDTTNTVTPVASRRRTSMAAAPGSLNLRGATIAGIAAGMTGGTLTKDGTSVGQLPIVVLSAAAQNILREDIFDDVNGTHPFALAQNEGLIIENRLLNVTSYGMSLYIDISWAEVTAY